MELIDDPALITGYLSDASNSHGHASALLRPQSPAQVAEIFAHCQAQRIPLTITAQRTSTTGAPVPMGGWLLSTERLVGLEIAADGASVRVGGGVLLGELQHAVAAKGRLYPPDPTSWEECSVGGSIACNASGARSYRYGPTRAWVLSAQVVLADGQILEVDRDTPIPESWPKLRWEQPHVKTASGYFPADNLLDLLIGSEGTLGLVVAATLRLTEPPQALFSVMGFFPDLATALQFVALARSKTGPSPRLIESFDSGCLEMMRSALPSIPDAAKHAIWIEQDTSPASEDSELMVWSERLEQAGALEEHTLFASAPAELERLAKMRHAIPAGINERVARAGMPKVGTDFSVPDGGLARVMAAYDAVPMAHLVFGHIGDNHLHCNLLPQSEEELAQAWQIWRDLYALALSLGGTLSAEHGVGKLKAPYLEALVGPETMAQFVALKRAVDPGWILGRGTLLAARSAEAV